MHFASMSLGILDFLIEWLSSFLIWIIGWVMDLIMVLFSHLFYMVASHLLEICDICQMIFKKLCGMGTFWYNHGGVNDGAGFNAGATLGKEYSMVDPLVTLFTNKTISQVLLTLSLVSVVMVIVASIIKIIQTEFSTEGSKNSKASIFGQALKCLVLFFMVPLCSIGGVIASNALLRTIDQATSLAAEGSTMGSQILVSAAAQQNIVRQGGNLSADDWKNIGVTSQPTITNSNREQYALVIDTAFRSNKVFSPDSFWGYQDVATVEKYYDVVGMNFVTLIGGALLAAYTMLMASFGMVMRLFKATILYVISPPMVALMPLDGGSAFKSWRKNFLGQVLSAYGTVVGLNLLFILLPVVNNINLFGNSDFPGVDGAGADGHIASVFNSFCHLIFTLTGLFMLKDLSKMIGDMIGADDAAGAGAGMAGKVVGTAAKIGSVAGGAVGGIVGKGVGSMMSKKAAKNMSVADQLEQSGDAAGAAKLREKAKRQATVGAAFGNTGNKLGQKAVGTFKGALNKGISMATGGGIKGTFSEETDYDKAMKAKKEKDDAREERFNSGEATLGDWAGRGTKAALKATGKAVVAAGGAAIGGVAGMVGGGIFGGRMMGAGGVLPGAIAGAGVGGADGAQTGWEFAGKAGTAISETFLGDGGAATRKKILATKPETDAGEATTSSTKKSYTDVAEAITKALGAGGGLTSGNAIDQSASLGAIIAALEAIASKTEEQKDLIQKLTAQKAKIDNTGTAMSTTELTALTTKLNTASSNATALSGTINFNASMSGSVTSKVEIDAEALARKIAEQNGLDPTLDADKIQAMINKMKKEMLAAYKTELEKLKEDAK